MNIKKVATLGETEVETLIAAGKILRELSDGLADSTIDELSSETANLLSALNSVLSSITTLA
jgi:hypothetical protein